MPKSHTLLNHPFGSEGNFPEFIRAAMQWHFDPTTGSAFWLERAKSLDFDPRRDIKNIEDLALFPNIVNELRDVRIEDLIPQGYGSHPDITGIYESGGTTGLPKRIIILHDWFELMATQMSSKLDAHEMPRAVNWLNIIPSGPHIVGDIFKQQAIKRGGVMFTIDMDPRWVKKRLAQRLVEEANAYTEHLIEQAAFALRTQNVGIIMTTPSMLERIARHDDLVEVINQKVKGIIWSGMHMDADTRHLLQTMVFPNVKFVGVYGSTLIGGGFPERSGLSLDDRCIFDPFSPFITFRVVNATTGHTVDYGEQGQVVMNYVNKNMFLPNNLERDLAIRVKPLVGQVGDAVADISFIGNLGDAELIEGVY